MRRQDTDWKKTFGKDRSDHGMVFKIYSTLKYQQLQKIKTI
jgi:hypothetical protein